ncbi:MAG: polysaccharide biosynthesis/export family protein [Candidatus Saccharibacteria bacterium]|nr:polysaccharide biosynthesis/export family protein [Moraxellaceae bacterium]
MLRLTQWIVISVSVSFLFACALAPGMRVGDLPPSGQLISEKGLNIQVETINSNNIPVTKNENNTIEALSLFDQKTHPIYLLAPGDVLGINLWANPEITPPGAASGFTIDQQGYIAFPLIGRIKAAGESLEGFSAKLQSRLSTYLKHPDVQVVVLAYVGRKFYVDGAVKASGQFSISNQPQNILSALASAGGAIETADMSNILLTRNGKSYHLGLFDLQKNNLSPSKLLLREGDSVHVYTAENRKLYLLGEAGDPSALLIPEQGMSLANVIGEGRGLNPLTSDRAQVYVVRDNAKNNLTNIYHVDLSTIANLALADRFKMQPNDIVYVDASGLARWSRVLNLLLPSAQGLGSISATGRIYK